MIKSFILIASIFGIVITSFTVHAGHAHDNKGIVLEGAHKHVDRSHGHHHSEVVREGGHSFHSNKSVKHGRHWSHHHHHGIHLEGSY